MPSDAAFTKLFASIIHSTVWREPDHVRLVWVTMLAMSDAEGYVGASLPGLADAARVSVEQCQEALDRLHAPDPHSRCKDFEGRRVATVERGWHLLTYDRHRRGAAAELERERKRDWWREHRGKGSSPSAPLATLADTSGSYRGQRQRSEAEAEVIPENTKPPRGKRAATRQQPNGHTMIIDRYRAAFVAVYSAEPMLTGGDRSQIGRMLRDRPPDRCAACWPACVAETIAAFVADPDPWLMEHRHPLRHLPGRANLYLRAVDWHAPDCRASAPALALVES